MESALCSNTYNIYPTQTQSLYRLKLQLEALWETSLRAEATFINYIHIKVEENTFLNAFFAKVKLVKYHMYTPYCLSNIVYIFTRKIYRNEIVTSTVFLSGPSDTSTSHEKHKKNWNGKYFHMAKWERKRNKWHLGDY